MEGDSSPAPVRNMPFPRPCVLLTTQPIIAFQLLEASGPAAGKGASDDSF